MHTTIAVYGSRQIETYATKQWQIRWSRKTVTETPNYFRHSSVFLPPAIPMFFFSHCSCSHITPIVPFFQHIAYPPILPSPNCAYPSINILPNPTQSSFFTSSSSNHILFLLFHPLLFLHPPVPFVLSSCFTTPFHCAHSHIEPRKSFNSLGNSWIKGNMHAHRHTQRQLTTDTDRQRDWGTQNRPPFSIAVAFKSA